MSDLQSPSPFTHCQYRILQIKNRGYGFSTVSCIGQFEAIPGNLKQADFWLCLCLYMNLEAKTWSQFEIESGNEKREQLYLWETNELALIPCSEALVGNLSCNQCEVLLQLSICLIIVLPTDMISFLYVIQSVLRFSPLGLVGHHCLLHPRQIGLI